MIQSMTGYSRTTRNSSFGTITVEFRSTNHRYLEVSQRLPEGLVGLEGFVAQLIRTHLHRGRLEVSLALQPRQPLSRRVVFDDALAQAYHEGLLALKTRLGLKGNVTLDHLLALPNLVGVADEQGQQQASWPVIRETVQRALRELLAMRRREGQRLLRDIRAQARTITQRLTSIRRRLPKSLAQQQRRLGQRLRQLLGNATTITRGQLEEALALVKDIDVHEELVRLDTHGAHLQQIVSGHGPIGKKLDFLAQELMREVNTLGAKANDALVARDVIQMKEAIEKIREQAQNLE